LVFEPWDKYRKSLFSVFRALTKQAQNCTRVAASLIAFEVGSDGLMRRPRPFVVTTFIHMSTFEILLFEVGRCLL